MKRLLLLFVFIFSLVSCTEEEWDEWETFWRYDDKPEQTEFQKNTEFDDFILKDSLKIIHAGKEFDY